MFYFISSGIFNNCIVQANFDEVIEVIDFKERVNINKYFSKFKLGENDELIIIDNIKLSQSLTRYDGQHIATRDHQALLYQLKMAIDDNLINSPTIANKLELAFSDDELEIKSHLVKCFAVVVNTFLKLKDCNIIFNYHKYNERLDFSKLLKSDDDNIEYFG